MYYKFGIRLLANSDFEPRAVRYLKIAADQRHLKAITKLASIYYYGYKVDPPILDPEDGTATLVKPNYYEIRRDRKEAAKYLKLATDLGDRDSMRKYRQMLYEGGRNHTRQKIGSLLFQS